MRVHLRSESLRGLLLDVEGTTTPVDFVYGTLFPYVRAHVREFFLHTPRIEKFDPTSNVSGWSSKRIFLLTIIPPNGVRIPLWIQPLPMCRGSWIKTESRWL